MSKHAAAVLGIGLICIGEEIGAEMAFRTFGNLVQLHLHWLCMVVNAAFPFARHVQQIFFSGSFATATRLYVGLFRLPWR